MDYEFNLDSKLTYFLPTLNGDGVLIYSMIHFLSSIQNEMLSIYYKKKSIEYEKLDAGLFENQDFAIIFNENNDLLRIVQANFIFESKNLNFNYENISDQICERLFQSRPLINMEVYSFSKLKI